MVVDRLSRAVRCIPATKKLDSEEFLNVVTYHLVADGIKPAVLLADHDEKLLSKLCVAYHKAFRMNARYADGWMHTAVGGLALVRSKQPRFGVSAHALKLTRRGAPVEPMRLGPI